MCYNAPLGMQSVHQSTEGSEKSCSKATTSTLSTSVAPRPNRLQKSPFVATLAHLAGSCPPPWQGGWLWPLHGWHCPSMWQPCSPWVLSGHIGVAAGGTEAPSLLRKATTRSGSSASSTSPAGPTTVSPAMPPASWGSCARSSS